MKATELLDRLASTGTSADKIERACERLKSTDVESTEALIDAMRDEGAGQGWKGIGLGWPEGTVKKARALLRESKGLPPLVEKDTTTVPVPPPQAQAPRTGITTDTGAPEVPQAEPPRISTTHASGKKAGKRGEPGWPAEAPAE